MKPYCKEKTTKLSISHWHTITLSGNITAWWSKRTACLYLYIIVMEMSGHQLIYTDLTIQNRISILQNPLNSIPLSCFNNVCIGGPVSYLRYLYLLAHSSVQHILCSVFVLFVLVLFTLCCQFLWIVHYWLPLWYSLTFIKQNIGHILNLFSKLYHIDNLQVTISVWKFLMMASCKEIVYMSGLVHNCNVHLIWQTDYNVHPTLDTFHTSHLQKYFLIYENRYNTTQNKPNG